MLVLDAVLTGAKGVNIWSSFRTPPPQRKARLYTALVDTGLASAVAGSLAPTAHPFLYTLSATATEGTSLTAVEEAATAAVDRVRRDGITAEELERARHQLHARLVFESDSVTSIAHQLGFFETIGVVAGVRSRCPARIDAVTLDEVNAVAAVTPGAASAHGRLVRSAARMTTAPAVWRHRVSSCRTACGCC